MSKPCQNILTHLRHRQYGLLSRTSILASIFHTGRSLSLSSSYASSVFTRSCSSNLPSRTQTNEKSIVNSRKRTVSENDENRRDSTDASSSTSKRLCRSSEWIFGDSQLTLLKSISTIDNRSSLIDETQSNYLLSKSDQYLSNHRRRYSSDKQQTLDTLSNLVLSQ
jgi:hypothetical protein